jgi:translocation and assembly module TamA
MQLKKSQGFGGKTTDDAFLRVAMSALLCSAVMLVGAPKASALEIFGFKIFESAEDEDADIVDPLNYSVTINVVGDDEIKETIEKASGLKADEERPVSGSLGLMAKARSERELLVAALYEQARYEGVVTVSIAGQSIDDLPPDAEFTQAQPIPVTVTVEPGPVFTLGDIRLAGDAANLSAVDYGLVSGGNAGSLEILKAEGLIVRALKDEGRPLAKIASREVVADHNTSTLDVTLNVAAGPIAGYGPTTVQGTETVDRDFTEYMTGLERGRTYSPEEVEDARERLTGLGVFNSVSLREAESLDANGQIPIDVTVTERKLRYFGAGATYSNTEGFGVEGYWGHRNLFGRAEKLRIEGAISRIGAADAIDKLNYNAGILFEKPGVIGPASKFFAGLRTVYEHPDAYDRFSVKASTGVSYELTKTQTVSAELAVDYSRIEDVFTRLAGTGPKKFLLVSTPLQYIYDNRDNRLNPTKGFRVLAYGEPTYDILTGAAFVKLRGEASAYQSFDTNARFVAAGRVAVGSIFGAGLDAVPADRRFYAGGGGSVRGYAYQGIGPKGPDGEPTGGLSYAEASAELRIGITETIGIVPFVDVGTVSTKQTPDFSDVKAGAGVGLRYLTPFGPLRVDAAVPLNPGPDDPSFGFYAGIGQSF